MHVLPLSHHWKAVLLGQAVCDELEQWSLLTASTLCQRLLKDTHTALDKVCVRVCAHTGNPKTCKDWKTVCNNSSVFFILERHFICVFIQIAHLLQHCDQTVREQLVVAQSLREEEKCILGSCLMELQSIQVTSWTAKCRVNAVGSHLVRALSQLGYAVFIMMSQPHLCFWTNEGWKPAGRPTTALAPEMQKHVCFSGNGPKQDSELVNTSVYRAKGQRWNVGKERRDHPRVLRWGPERGEDFRI